MSLTSYRAAPPRDTDVCVDCDAKRGLFGPLLEGTEALEIVNGFSLRRL